MIVILVAIVVPRMGGGGKFADLTPFSVEAYRKDWATLQGNSYRLDCQVEQQLAFVEGRGRVLAVKPEPLPLAVTVIVAVPGATAVTCPEPDTVATDADELA